MKNKIAKRMEGLKGSVIRAIVDAANKPGIISFANGNPSSETFPIKELAAISSQCLADDCVKVLQYGTAHGYAPLIEILKERLSVKFNLDFKNNALTIVSGATQACDLISKIFLDENDLVITEEPSYASCFNIFRIYGAGLKGVKINEDGIDINELSILLAQEKGVKMLYTIPSFANPTGATASMEKRKELYALAQKHDFFIFEDDPYSELRYHGDPVFPIKSLDIDGRVFYVGSLSKVIAPSMRIGFVVYDKSYMPLFNIAKQTTDVHSNLLAQHIAYNYIAHYNFEKHISFCRQVYRQRCSFMSELLRKHLHPSVELSSPDGGLFIMMLLPSGYDSVEFAMKALDRGVACVPDSGFMIDPDKSSNMVRLCYSTATQKEIEAGVKILGALSYELFG
ncbi:MAG: PLP-dependent aminotransferase family protein [Synergistaceae bacterium]|nr:PLP-dependent aminotransferase family protein [Synergistaceae bacterium]